MDFLKEEEFGGLIIFSLCYDGLSGFKCTFYCCD